MKTILITGGSGFIGRNLIEGLGKKYHILSPTHQDLDLTDSAAVNKYFKKNSIDVVIHSAVGKGQYLFKDTISMFLNLYRNIDKVKKFIYFGSGAEYDKSRDLVKIKESEFGKYIPKDDYGLAKYICHSISKNNPKVVNLRLFGIYGKYEDYLFKFISNSIAKNIFKQPIIIKQNVIFDYLYIDDLISIVEFIVEHRINIRDLNIIPSKSIALSEIVDIINQISSNKSKIVVNNKGFNYQYTGSNKRLKILMPDLTFTSYFVGIKKLYNYYTANLDLLDKNKVIKDDYYHKSKIKKIKI
ncbi:hypothetical protein A3C23_00850 [Candidatus Roizmanbacteria bacterium RIFCSPHIGHO2_02_FULL_37_13b]|uniref:NAD-dependent epimerase/dehydratase domain-containing protein n=1 Tax=Candidatus Roizmanbacteria bacterium RIFCSPLOWO2_02_FULL_36_11 TaxID=1802071 RepID=A0A1F7JIW3_9BACT|nr:MAG: hypothetical protein A3C23_00850 [Candidatus Roizmanbacteria bacterium RIFCSPHIGHO2_02_FULL_37_13b]OGK55557.1 MAG: hypothetical protein A3H78_05335 [Candidatus Roizmanbacteria bacterium RIFCSPLOWO2_02_FULL_36_11]